MFQIKNIYSANIDTESKEKVKTTASHLPKYHENQTQGFGTSLLQNKFFLLMIQLK